MFPIFPRFATLPARSNRARASGDGVDDGEMGRQSSGSPELSEVPWQYCIEAGPVAPVERCPPHSGLHPPAGVCATAD